MQPVLLVEDSLMFGKLAKRKIEENFKAPVFWAKSLEEADKLLKSMESKFSLALLDFNLPDAPHGEAIDRVVAEGISSLVFTGNMSEEVRSQVWQKKVADYIIKEDPNSLNHVVSAMQQITANQDTLVLFAADSPDIRTAVSELLYIRKFRVLNAPNAKTALEILNSYPEIKLVITDFSLPDMNGTKLCQKIREKFNREKLAIIGLSSTEEQSTGARFIKSGADDFMVKQSFLVEEFYSRVNRALESVQLFKEKHESSTRDPLTGMYNRGYFFEVGQKLVKKCHQENKSLALAILDVDYLKDVNESHGHGVGDEVLKNLAEIIVDCGKEGDFIARIDGEQFSLLLPDTNADNSFTQLETLRQVIESTPMTFLSDGSELFITCSIGCCITDIEDFDEIVKLADQYLFRAKAEGRNSLTIQDTRDF